MNCRNAFQIYLYFENCMTSRVSLKTRKKEIFTKKVWQLECISVLAFPLLKSSARVSLWCTVMRRYNACFPSFSFSRYARYCPQ